jgi:hypothetical protein
MGMTCFSVESLKDPRTAGVLAANVIPPLVLQTNFSLIYKRISLTVVPISKGTKEV